MTTFVQLGEQDNAFDLANVLDRLHGRSSAEQQIAAQQREAQYQQQLAEYQQRRDAGEDVGEEEEPHAEEKSELARLVLAAEFVRLIEDGVLKSMDVIMQSSEADIEVVFALTFALFPRLSTTELARITSALLPHLTASASPSAASSSPSAFTRLRLLTQLFNLLNSTLGTAQILPNLPLTSTNTLANVGTDLVASVLIATLRFAAQTEQAKQVVPSLPVLASLVTSWELKPATLSDFYLLSYELTRQVGGRGEDEHLYKYLKAMDRVAAEGGGEKLLVTARTHAFTAAHRAISSPLSSSAFVPTQPSAFTSSSSPLTPHRLLTLAAINALASGTADDQSIHTLLRLFATDDVDAYIAFASSHAAFLSSHSLSHPLLLQKLRILSLCALASTTADNRLSYSVIADRLSLGSDVEVEMAVIDAIVSGRLDAKIDQDKAQVVVRRVVGSVLRVKGGGAAGGGVKGGVVMEADWAALEKRLGGWKANMAAVLTKLSGEAAEMGEEL